MMKFLNLYLFVISLLPSLFLADTTEPESTTEHTEHEEETHATQPEEILQRYVIENELKPAIFGSFKFDPIHMIFNSTNFHTSTTEDYWLALRNGSEVPKEAPVKVTILENLNDLLRRSTPVSWLGNNRLN